MLFYFFMKSFIKIGFVLAAMLLFTARVEAQYASESELIKGADALFEARNYREALPLYSQLLANHPQDKRYSYRYGACALFMESNKSKSLRFLEYGSKGSGTIDPEALFFMGKGYHLNYRFKEALVFYNKFKDSAPEKLKEEFEIDLHIRTCQNGINLLKSITDIRVIERVDLNRSDFYRTYKMQEFNGKIVSKLDDFKSKYDKKIDDESIMYIQQNSNIVYYSGYDDKDKGKNGKDIFYVTRPPGGDWSAPQSIGAPINTPYDEDFPFIHPNGKKLYFCSKGHNSMGGYDVFESTFDEATGKWSKPNNLDFAINTPDDDFMFVTDEEEKVAYFSSTRQSEDGKVTVYKINLQRLAFNEVLIKGNFTGERTNLSTITVKEKTTGKEIGIFNSDKKTGDYAFSLPNGGKYVFQVQMEGSSVLHEGEVGLPKLKDPRPLKQEMKIVRDEKDYEQLVINNLFDEIIEEDLPLTAELLQKKATLEVNADEISEDELSPSVSFLDVPEDGDNSGPSVTLEDPPPASGGGGEQPGDDPTNDGAGEGDTGSDEVAEGPTADDIIKSAYEEAGVLESRSDELSNQAALALALAQEKTELASKKNKEADDLLASVEESSEAEQEAVADEAYKLKKEAQKLSKEANMALIVGEELKTQAGIAKDAGVEAMMFAREAETAANADDLDLGLKKVDQIKKLIQEEDSKSFGLDAILSARKERAATKKEEADQELAKAKEAEEEIKSIDTDLENFRSEAKKASDDAVRDQINEEITALEQARKDKFAERNLAFDRADRLQEEADIFNEETTFTEELAEKASSGEVAENVDINRVDTKALQAQITSVSQSSQTAELEDPERTVSDNPSGDEIAGDDPNLNPGDSGDTNPGGDTDTNPSGDEIAGDDPSANAGDSGDAIPGGDTDSNTNPSGDEVAGDDPNANSGDSGDAAPGGDTDSNTNPSGDEVAGDDPNSNSGDSGDATPGGNTDSNTNPSGDEIAGNNPGSSDSTPGGESGVDSTPAGSDNPDEAGLSKEEIREKRLAELPEDYQSYFEDQLDASNNEADPIASETAKAETYELWADKLESEIVDRKVELATATKGSRKKELKEEIEALEIEAKQKREFSEESYAEVAELNDAQASGFEENLTGDETDGGSESGGGVSIVTADDPATNGGDEVAGDDPNANSGDSGDTNPGGDTDSNPSGDETAGDDPVANSGDSGDATPGGDEVEPIDLGAAEYEEEYFDQMQQVNLLVGEEKKANKVIEIQTAWKADIEKEIQALETAPESTDPEAQADRTARIDYLKREVEARDAEINRQGEVLAALDADRGTETTPEPYNRLDFASREDSVNQITDDFDRVAGLAEVQSEWVEALKQEIGELEEQRRQSTDESEQLTLTDRIEELKADQAAKSAELEANLTEAESLATGITVVEPPAGDGGGDSGLETGPEAGDENAGFVGQTDAQDFDGQVSSISTNDPAGDEAAKANVYIAWAESLETDASTLEAQTNSLPEGEEKAQGLQQVEALRAEAEAKRQMAVESRERSEELASAPTLVDESTDGGSNPETSDPVEPSGNDNPEVATTTPTPAINRSAKVSTRYSEGVSKEVEQLETEATALTAEAMENRGEAQVERDEARKASLLSEAKELEKQAEQKRLEAVDVNVRLNRIRQAEEAVVDLEPGEQRESEKEAERADRLASEATAKTQQAAEVRAGIPEAKKKEKAVLEAKALGLEAVAKEKSEEAEASRSLSMEMAKAEEIALAGSFKLAEKDRVTLPAVTRQLSAEEEQSVASSPEYQNYNNQMEEVRTIRRSAQVEYILSQRLREEARVQLDESGELLIEMSETEDEQERQAKLAQAQELDRKARANQKRADSVDAHITELNAEADFKENQANAYVTSLNEDQTQGILAYQQLKYPTVTPDPADLALADDGRGGAGSGGSRGGNDAQPPNNGGGNPPAGGYYNPPGGDVSGGDEDTNPVTPPVTSDPIQPIPRQPISVEAAVAKVENLPPKLDQPIFAKTTSTEVSVYNEEKPIPLNPRLPEGLVFKVQIGAFRNPIPQDLFSGFAPIMGESTDFGVTRYTAGVFDSESVATNARDEIRNISTQYSDAFVVAYYNGSRVSMDEARALIGGSGPAVASSNPPSAGTNAGGNPGGNPGGATGGVAAVDAADPRNQPWNLE